MEIDGWRGRRGELATPEYFRDSFPSSSVETLRHRPLFSMMLERKLPRTSAVALMGLIFLVDGHARIVGVD